MSYRAVLFDMDGVIINSEPLHVTAFQATLKEHGHELSQGQYKEYFAGRTDEAGFERYFESLDERVELSDIMGQKARKYLELASDQLVPYPGAIECIDELAHKNIILALVTGSLRVEAEITLKSFNLMGEFSAIIAAEDITRSKPNPEGYLKGAKALGIAPSDCVVVEDAPSGVQAARAAGMRCVAVTSTHTRAELAGATLILDQLKPGCMDAL